MRAILLAVCLVCASLAGANPAWAETREPETHFFQPKFGDFKAELQTAREQGKKGVFLFFEMDDCAFCARMKATILNQPEVQDAYRADFLVYSVDVNGDVAMTDFAGRETTEKAFALEHRVRATPTMIFFDLDGRPVTRYTGPTRDVAEFLLLRRYVVEGAYASQPFAAYKRGP